MVLILTSIILLNSGIIAYLWTVNIKSRELHFKKTEMLESIIIELLKNHDDLNEKVQLADELKEMLKRSKNKLNVDILSLQYDVLHLLSQNKLIG